MNLLNKIDRKLDALQLYCFAKKICEYDIRITGDIDDPNWIYKNQNIINDWVTYASSIGPTKPIIYLTASNDFQKDKEAILNINSNVDVAIHGLKHIHYSKLKTLEIQRDLEKQTEFSSSHRYPYLDWNLTAIWCASELFKEDSSLVSRWMNPFKIGNMIEYPICPPTDTALREKPVTSLVVKMYRHLVDQAEIDDRTLTLLLHPNSWSVELLRSLLKQ